ncbi:MAG: hypothetical protein RIR77_1654 [Planctomycetota bacterium]|jgi:hypothetical protein
MNSTTTTRGNTLVLVTAILVLLVIIATAFLVRAQSGRAQAAAQQKATGREARVESVAADVAQEVANALFVKRIDSSSMTAAAGQIAANQATGLTGQPAFGEFMARSDFPRLPAEPLAIRYGVDYFDSVSNLDFTSVAGGDGYLDGYNFAPFSVNPFTNWPARYGDITGEGNPIGNPGFGDTRWLASTEPVRAMLLTQLQNPVAPAPPNTQVPLPFNANWGNLALSNGAPILSPEGLGFSHWPHMSWIPTAENGFRLCWNISNVESNWDHMVPAATPAAADRWAAGELNLGTPYEQWLPYVAPREPLVTGKDARGYLVLDSTDWQNRVSQWFNVGITNFNTVPPHAQMIKGVNGTGVSTPIRRLDALPNFLQLGAFGDPSDEFKQILSGTAYVPTSRNLIGRTLADADGDGWTDSFWFVAPSSSDRSTRQLIAVRIMDNSALINVNTATRSDRASTNGLTPSDVALVTRRDSYDETSTVGNTAGFRDPIVGFFNARENDPEYRVNFSFKTLLPAPAAQPSQTAAKLVYAVASNAAGPTGGVDVGWAPERWEGRRTQLAAAGGNTADPYQTGFLRDIGMTQEGTAGNVNSVVPFFDPSADFGLTGSSAVYGDSFVLSRAADRLSYFKAMANGGELVDPVTATRLVTLSPFGSDDEIELRAASGQNSPQTVSRIENALNSSASMYSTDILFGEFLRSTRSREESARFFDPDDVRVQDWRARAAWSTGAAFAPRGGAELLLDHRRMMTTISGARNEMLPPRLWTVVDHSLQAAGTPDTNFVGNSLRVRPAYLKRGVDFDLDGNPDDVTGDGAVTTADDLAPYHPNIMFPAAGLIPAASSGFGIAIRDANGDGVADVEDFERGRQRFLTDNRKIDLRRPNDVPTVGVAATPTQITQADRKFDFDLQRVMRRALIDEGTRQSYLGRPGQNSTDANASLAATKMMIASFSANVLCYRDGKRRITNTMYLDQPLHPTEAIAVPTDALGTSGITDGGFIGVEKQPFIQEVFLAFVYPKSKVTQAELDAVLGPPGGNPLPGCPDPDNCSLNASDPFALPSCTANGAGEHFVVYDPANPATWPAVVFVAQIANPFNEPVNLADFELRINPASGSPQRFFFGLPGPTGSRSGNTYGPDVELGPCTPEEPRTALVFSLPEKFPNGDAFPRDAWLDFLDIGASIDTDGDGTITTTEADPSNDIKPGQFFKPDINAIFSPAWGGSSATGTQYFDANRRGGTLYFDATRTTAPTVFAGLDVSGDMNRWKPSPSVGGAPPTNSYIELRRAIYPSNGGTPSWTVVDRFENELDPTLDGQTGQRVTDLINRLYIDGSGGSLPPPPAIVCRSGSLAIDGIRMQTGDFFTTWARGSRQWLFDTQAGITPAPPGVGVITMDERTPRYAFARTTGVMASSSPNGGSVGRETYVGGTQEGVGRKGEIIANATSLPDGDATGSPQSLWISSLYHNIWGELKRGKPTFFPTRIPESTQTRTYKYPAWLLANATPPTGMTLNYGEKGVSDRKFVNGADPSNFTAPYRLFQKDADFDQAAEILDVPLWGTLVQRTGSGRAYATLAEILAQPQDSTADLYFPKFPKPATSTGVLSYGSDQEHYNRLQLEPAQYDTVAPTGGRPTLLSGIQTMPPTIEGAITATTPPQQNGIGFNARLPGGAALLDAFVVDDRGAAPFDAWTATTAPDNVIDFNERATAENRRLRLARNFEGKLTPGLININTAPIEVLHAMPQMMRLVYDDDFPITKTADSDPATLNAASSALSKRRLVRDPLAWQAAPYDMGGGNPGPGNPNSILFDYGVAAPRVRVAEAMELWRNKGNVLPDLSNNLFQNMPSYYSRGLDFPDASNHREWAPGTRSERGFDSIGELAVLTKGAEFAPTAASDADGNGTPDVQDIAKGKVADVNRNNVADSADAAALVGSSWNQAEGWSIRFAGTDPYRTKWDDPSWGAGRGSSVGSGPQSVGGTALAYRTEGIPQTLTAGQAQVYPLTGRTAIDKHLLVTATDDRNTIANEINDPSNDSLGTQFVESKAYHYDMTSGDAVEQNQMLRGISNIVTTRSDVFTIWLRIRTIKQDTLTGQWNGTDPESIVDDSRYMMTIDRSSVDRPGEQPRIVSFVKVPN